MKISNSFSIPKVHLNSGLKNNVKKEKINYSQKNFVLPNYKSYVIPFTGGKSLNLQETFNMLDETQFPPDIYKMVNETLIEGNPSNKRLYDIHFEKYQGVNDCFSLEELKEKYPEFEDVVSAYDTDVQKGVIYDFQNKESKYFDNDEDLTLQLIKLYWGKGLSFSDLEHYTATASQEDKGINLYRVFNNLNIPTLEQTYAQYLKLSNEEYNLEITKKMSQLLKEANDKKLQKLDGEPIYIPRTPLSEEHKKHISEGLKKYYLENPERIYNLSKRQTEYLKENPFFAEKFSLALKVAWNTQDGKSIRKAITKYAKKQANINEEALFLKKTINEDEKRIFSGFWKKNSWARQKFSNALKRGWEYASNAPEIYSNEKNDKNRITMHILPTRIAKSIKSWEKIYPERQLREERRYGSIHKNTDDILAQSQDNAKLYKELTLENKNIIDYFSTRPTELKLFIEALEDTIAIFALGDISDKNIIPTDKKIKNANGLIKKCFLDGLRETRSMMKMISKQEDISQKINDMLNFEYYNLLLNDFSYYLLETFGENAHYITEFFNKELDKNYNKTNPY